MLNYFTWIPEVLNSRKEYLDELDCFKHRSIAIRHMVNARDCGQNDGMIEEIKSRLQQAELLIQQADRNLSRVSTYVYLKIPMINNHYKEIKELNIKLKEDRDNLQAMPPLSMIQTVVQSQLYSEPIGQQINIKLKLIQSSSSKSPIKHSHRHNHNHIIVQKTYQTDKYENMVLHTFTREDYNGKLEDLMNISRTHAEITCQRKLQVTPKKRMMTNNNYFENNTEFEYVYEFTLVSKAQNVIFIRYPLEEQIILRKNEQVPIYQNTVIVFKEDKNMEIELGYEFQYKIDDE